MDKYYLFKRNYNPGSWCSSVNVVTVLLVEWQGNSGFGFGLGAMFFFLFSVSYGFGDPQTSCAMDTGRSCHGIKMAGDVKLPNDLNLVPRPKTTGAVFILLLQPLVSSLSVNGRTVCRLRANCSPLSTGILYGCLKRVTIPDAVIIKFVLLKISKVLLETYWGL